MKLIICRHGQRAGDGNLEDVGREEVRNLAEKIKEIVDADAYAIFSSDDPCAVQTAEVITGQLGAQEVRVESVLRSRTIDDVNITAAWELCDQAFKSGATTVIVVTHLEYTQHLPAHVARLWKIRVRGTDIYLESFRGWAKVLDSDDLRWWVLRP